MIKGKKGISSTVVSLFVLVLTVIAFMSFAPNIFAKSSDDVKSTFNVSKFLPQKELKLDDDVVLSKELNDYTFNLFSSLFESHSSNSLTKGNLVLISQSDFEEKLLFGFVKTGDTNHVYLSSNVDELYFMPEGTSSEDVIHKAATEQVFFEDALFSRADLSEIQNLLKNKKVAVVPLDDKSYEASLLISFITGFHSRDTGSLNLNSIDSVLDKNLVDQFGIVTGNRFKIIFEKDGVVQEEYLSSRNGDYFLIYSYNDYVALMPINSGSLRTINNVKIVSNGDTYEFKGRGYLHKTLVEELNQLGYIN